MGGDHSPHPTASQAGLAAQRRRGREGEREKERGGRGERGEDDRISTIFSSLDSLTYHWGLPFSIFFFIPTRQRNGVRHVVQRPRLNSYQSSGSSASGSGMNSGPSSSHPSGLTASGSGILGGASSSQSSGLEAVGSGILEWKFEL